MAYYLDVKVRPHPDLAAHIVLAEVFRRAHLWFVENSCTSVGLSFPEYDSGARQLGHTIRFQGLADSIRKLANDDFLGVCHEDCELTQVLAVPKSETMLRVTRAQCSSSSVNRRIRRAIKRRGLSPGEATVQYRDFAERRLSLPFLFVQSSSTQQKFPLFIRQEAATAVSGNYSKYGLSSGGSTVCAF